MKKHIFGRITGPIIVLAVHLCGTLSIKAVDMFNNNDNVKLFALKPCCLPKMVYANRGDIFKLGNHEFDAKDVCSNGAFNKKNWDGPPRWHLQVMIVPDAFLYCTLYGDYLGTSTHLFFLLPPSAQIRFVGTQFIQGNRRWTFGG